MNPEQIQQLEKELVIFKNSITYNRELKSLKWINPLLQAEVEEVLNDLNFQYDVLSDLLQSDPHYIPSLTSFTGFCDVEVEEEDDDEYFSTDNEEIDLCDSTCIESDDEPPLKKKKFY